VEIIPGYGSYAQVSPLEVREVAQVGAAHKTTGAWRAGGFNSRFYLGFNLLSLSNLILFGFMWLGWVQVDLA
jgi:hypothetical protein